MMTLNKFALLQQFVIRKMVVNSLKFKRRLICSEDFSNKVFGKKAELQMMIQL